MRNIMNEWDVQKVASNLDRIDFYRTTKKNSSQYLNPSEITDVMSEWDVQKVASNLDRIESQRNLSPDAAMLELKVYIMVFLFLGLAGLWFFNKILFFLIVGVTSFIVIKRKRKSNNK